jgi:Zn-dependent peptidase ImmA (M78 family)
VLIDESLHPCEFPELQGRLRFTYAHEIAHWCLHRNELDVALGWMRRNPAREIVREKEANRFAGALMMPRDLLRPAWRRAFGVRTISREDLLPQRSKLIRDEIARRRFLPDGDDALERLMFEGAVSGLANQFGVSPWAMRIRCEQLGLIVR